jgi:hypothetical protein
MSKWDLSKRKYRLSGKKLVNVLDVEVIQTKWPEPVPDDVIVIDDYSDMSDIE